MILIKKNVTHLYEIVSLGWVIVGIYGIIFNFISLHENRYKCTFEDILKLGLLTLAYFVIAISLTFFEIKSIKAYLKKTKIKHYNLWLVFNAICIYLLPDTYLSAIWYQVLGELSNQSIIYFINPLLTSEFFCIVTMLNMLVCNESRVVCTEQ